MSSTPRFDHVFAPSVLYDSVSGIYKMWFSSVLSGGNTWNVSYATSIDGATWTVYNGSPVLRAGPTGSFDSRWLIDPYVLRIGATYTMYYTGYDGIRWQTGLATSPDGINWTKHPSNPILRTVPGSTWESVGANCPKVHFDGSLYRMIYSGYNGSSYAIGLATSTDGVNFTRHTGNPVLRNGPPSSWDAGSAFLNSFVFHAGTMYVMYNGGVFSPVGFATSIDGGIHWQKYAGNPVFTTGPPGSWDASRITVGSLAIRNAEFHYWYTACRTISGTDIWRIGYARGSFASPQPPAIRISPDSLLFGSVQIGSTASHEVRITNASFSDTLRILSLETTNPRFHLPPNYLTHILPPGETRTFSVIYAPVSAQTDTGSILIRSNDPLRPIARIVLTGRGIAPGAAPFIAWIRDIPEDQGKQVRISWYPSIHDRDGDTSQIVQYGVWRKVGNLSGQWDFIAAIPAVRFERYSFVSPTLYDSTRFWGMRWSVFRVSAHTANNLRVFFSDPDSGYSVDNLPPGQPGNPIAIVTPGMVELRWDATPDRDVMTYRVYRSASGNFIPTPSNLIGQTGTTVFFDTRISGGTAWFYKIEAVDSSGNISPSSAEVQAILTGTNPPGEKTPREFLLHQNFPNPFNPSTEIRYDLPEAAHVSVTILDILGRAVATLVDDIQAPGYKSVRWQAGNISSGVYFYTLSAGQFRQTRKMLLAR